jgi:hypothetical protein
MNSLLAEKVFYDHLIFFIDNSRKIITLSALRLSRLSATQVANTYAY